MKRFIWRTTLLIVVLMLICAAVVGLPRLQPLQPLLSDEIKRCGEQICVRNVIIDKTTLGEAMKLLSSDPGLILTHNANTVTASAKWGSLIFAGVPVPSGIQTKVENIETYYWKDADTPFPMLGDFIIRYGPPCKVRPYLDTGMVSLFYSNMYLTLVKDDGSELYGLGYLTPFLSVAGTMSYNGANFCTFESPSVQRPWTGFKALIDYN